jgi:hypothetical protein
LDGSKAPELVFGQPDFYSGACNGDNNLGFGKAPTASTLCLMNFPTANNVAEDWMRLNFGVDSRLIISFISSSIAGNRM